MIYLGINYNSGFRIWDLAFTGYAGGKLGVALAYKKTCLEYKFYRQYRAGGVGMGGAGVGLTGVGFQV